MIRKSIIFTDVPLLKAFLYRERFQLVPFFYFRGAPFSKFTRHFPAVLEYECEDKEEMQPMEAELLKRGLSENGVKLGRSIPESQRVKREILHLLTALIIIISLNIMQAWDTMAFRFRWMILILYLLRIPRSSIIR